MKRDLSFELGVILFGIAVFLPRKCNGCNLKLQGIHWPV